MKGRKMCAVLSACVAVVMTVVAGCSFGGRDSAVPDVAGESRTAGRFERDDLTVVGNTVLYAACSLAKMADISSDIVIAEVVSIGETTFQFPDDAEEDLPEGVMCTAPLQTAVTLKVKESIKGAEPGEEILYYEAGGVMEEYMQLPRGYGMEEGMEVLLFLSEDGYSYGGQGEFLMLDGFTVIPRSSDVREYLDGEKIVTVQQQSFQSEFRSLIRAQEVDVMTMEDFTSAVRELMQ